MSPGDVSLVSTPPRGAPHQPIFVCNQMVAGRYRIVRFIARGGMGEVYEAEDQGVSGHLALKTILPEIAVDARAVERFKREIHVARKVTHPNVCRIYDLGTHRASSLQEVFFLTMELLAGETLSARIARARRLTTAEAHPILMQIAAGLDSAHAAGVIHRDFKSGNVVLVPEKQARTRAVITDFGLARGTTADGSLSSLSDTNAVVGTPAYMAPEQVQGLALTAAVDIYALGVVMYEMLTGVRPFDGDSPMGIAVRRVTEEPPTPRLHVPDLDPIWESVVLRCLARDPAARFASASAACRALSGEGSSATETVHVPSGSYRQRQRWRYVVASIALAWVVAAAYLVRTQRPALPDRAALPSDAPVAARPALAVLGFKNVSGHTDTDWLSTAIAEMLRTDLAAGGRLRGIGGQEVERARRELGLTDYASFAPDVSARIRANLGADLLVLGSYTVIGGPGSRLLRIDLRLQDAASGDLMASGTANGTEVQLFDLVSRAAGPLREKLGLGSVSPAQALEMAASLPSNPEAARLYSAGLARLRKLDALGARDVLEKAVAAEPGHPLPHVALSAAWSVLGYANKARDEARKAAAAAGSLPGEDRLSIEARLHETEKDWPKAIEAYRSLLGSSPDHLEWGLRLAEAQTAAGDPRATLVTLETLRKLPAPLSGDPRIDLVHARAFEELGDRRQARVAAGKAATAGAAREAWILAARARLVEAAALDGLGDREGATAAGEEARRLFGVAGDRSGVARALERMGLTLQASGDLDGARRLYEKALATHRGTGDEGSVARVLHNLGSLLLAKGSATEADRLFEQSLATFKRIGAKREAAEAANNIAARLHISGDLAGAQKRYQGALALFGGIGERSGVAMVLTNLGEVVFTRGELDQARQMYEEALALNRELGEKSGAAYDLFRLGELFAAKGDLRVARGRYNEALILQEQGSERIAAAQTRLGLSSLSLAEGQAANAETLARGAEEVLRTEGAADGAALAQRLLAESLLAQGRQDEARKAVDQAKAASARSEDFGIRTAVTIVAARIAATSKAAAASADALRVLERTAAAAEKAGFVAHAYEARLAQGEIEMASGRAAAGKARLQALAKEAGAKGFGLITHRAEKATAS